MPPPRSASLKSLDRASRVQARRSVETDPISGRISSSPPPRPASARTDFPRRIQRNGGRTSWTAPAGLGMRFMAARNFGKVRQVKARNVWEIDVRPYGRFRAIPVQGAKPIQLTSREMAESVLAQIRAEVQ